MDNLEASKWFEDTIQMWTNGEEKMFANDTYGKNRILSDKIYKPRIELGGSKTLLEMGIEGVALQNADVNADIFSWLASVQDESVSTVRAKDFLEHIPHCKNSWCQHTPAPQPRSFVDIPDLCTVALMKEISRVLIPGGYFCSLTPSTDGRGAFQDPTHVSFWNENSFWYYTEDNISPYIGLKPLFKKESIWTCFLDNWGERNNISYVAAILRK